MASDEAYESLGAIALEKVRVETLAKAARIYQTNGPDTRVYTLYPPAGGPGVLVVTGTTLALGCQPIVLGPAADIGLTLPCTYLELHTDEFPKLATGELRLPPGFVLGAFIPPLSLTSEGLAEVVCTSCTGGKKGSKQERMSLVDPRFLRNLALEAGRRGDRARLDLVPVEMVFALADLYAEGLKKYGEGNWMKGYDWSLSYDANWRHFLQFWSDGQSNDPETNACHLIASIWHLTALYIWHTKGAPYLQFDDRPFRDYTGAAPKE